MTPPPYGWPAAALEGADRDFGQAAYADPVTRCPLQQQAADDAQAIEPEPPAPEADEPEAPARASVADLTRITVVRVRFLGHHGVLRHHLDDFVLAGEPYEAPHWDAARAGAQGGSIADRVREDRVRPVAHTRGEPIRLEVTFRVEGAAADEGKVRECEFVGSGGVKHLKFVGRAEVTIGQEVTVECTAERPLPNVVQILDRRIQWRAVAHRSHWYRRKQTLRAGSSGPHPIYVVMGPPREDPPAFLQPQLPDVDDGWRFDAAAAVPENNELGATWRRMDLAVRYYVWARDRYAATYGPRRNPAWQTRVDRRAGLTPSQAVMVLMAQWSHYVLGERPELADLHAADHPRYLRQAGPWPMLEAKMQGLIEAAECQAMVRGTLAVLCQIGCPGTLEKIMVFAHPANAAATEGTHPCKGLAQFAERFGHATSFVRHRTDAQARAARQGAVERRIEQLEAGGDRTGAEAAELEQLGLDLHLNVHAEDDATRESLLARGARPWDLGPDRAIAAVSLKPHLLDAELLVGEFLDPGTALRYHVDRDVVVPTMGGRTQRRAGANAFEACLKYTPDGEPAKYYPAGVGQADDIDHVIQCFNRLVLVSTIRLTDGMAVTHGGVRIDHLRVPRALRGTEVWYCERVVHAWR